MSDPSSAVVAPALEPRSVTVDGVRWDYLVGGEGAGRPLLVLHGALGGAETVAWFARLLAARRKVIAPTLPAVSTTYDVARGIGAVLDAERVRVADVIGGSYGGLVAQAYLQERPERVGRVVLASTGAPDRARAGGERWVTALLSVLPVALLRSLARRKLARHLQVDAPPEARERLAASTTLVNRAIEGLTRDLFLARIRLSYEFHRLPVSSFSPHPVLILESDDDPMIDAAARARLRDAFHTAEVRTFSGAGHLISILRTDEMLEAVEDFLSR